MATKQQTTAAVARIHTLRNGMKAAGVDALIISHTPHLRYLFGFSGSTATAIISQRDLFFFTNDLYAVQVEKEVYNLDGLKKFIDRDVWGTAAKHAIAKKWKTVGFDPTRTLVSQVKAIKKAMSPATLKEVRGLVEQITTVKTPSEIKDIATAAQIASTTYERLLSFVKPGMTEHEVATFIASTSRQLGSEKDAFDIICVSGARSAMPHGRASAAVIKSGDVVTVDFGCCWNGMYSDMTRVFALGTPHKKVVDVFAVLYDAHLSALDAAVSGVNAAKLDGAARDLITAAGYGENFKHSLGHGLGYEVHEDPRVSWANVKEEIPSNCVITIEPGIYIPGKFGMRIEDDVVVTPKGADILTTAPRELVIV